MDSVRRHLNPAIERKTFALNQDDTDDLDDTLPVEVLDCIETTTNDDWLSRSIQFPGKVNCAATIRVRDQGIRSESSAFNPPLSSTRYRSDGSSSEFSDVSTTAECGSALDDDILSAAATKKSNGGHFVPSLIPAPSMEFQPLRCSTAVTTNDLVSAPIPRGPTFEIRVDSAELKSVRCSVAATESNNDLRPCASLEFNPLRCSTGLNDVGLPPKPTEMRPPTPEEYFTACSSSTNTIKENNTHFQTALGITQTNGTIETSTKRRSTDKENLPSVEVPVAQTQPQPPGIINGTNNADNDLSIMMQCHLKIRNGRQIIETFQAKPQIEFSLYKDSPIGSSVFTQPIQTKSTTVEGKSKIPSRRSNPNLHDGDHSRQRYTHYGTNLKPVFVESRPYDTASSSVITTNTNKQHMGRNNLQKGKSTLEESPNTLEGRQSPEPRNRIQRAVENLASKNIQKTISALPILDSSRSAILCETIAEHGLIDNIYDFLSKMNRSVAHQVACVHATSLLLDLAKHSFSAEKTWQNGERIGLLFNLMTIWACKDNAIFLNCATLLWVYCQDETRANMIRRFVASQNKVLEKISAKFNSKMYRPTNKLPTLTPSWTNSGLLRTFDNPITAYAGLSGAINK